MARTKRNKLPDLTLVLDFGGSLTKAIYTGSSPGEKLLCMEPEVISVPKSAVDTYERIKLGNPTPADAAWVGYDDSYYVVGYLARSQFNGNAGLSQLKYERAFPKTLAAVWVAAMALGLKNKFTAAIAVLLPASEYENRQRLEELLREGLTKFDTPNGILNVTLTHFDCKPEGAGVYLMHESNQPAALQHKICAVVMIGYRNASILVAERGQVGKRETSELGFIRMVKLVERRISGLPATAQLASAIAMAGHQPNPTPLKPLMMASVPDEREEDLRKLVDAIHSCRSQYVMSLHSWFREVLPKTLDEVLLSGGTAEYLAPELEKYFAEIPISWNAAIELPDSLQDAQIGHRLCDAYGMYQYFKTLIWDLLHGSFVGVS